LDIYHADLDFPSHRGITLQEAAYVIAGEAREETLLSSALHQDLKSAAHKPLDEGFPFPSAELP